jgi:hypothetical protein
MKVDFLVICDHASVTREGKLNVVGIFKQIYVQRLPTRYLRFFAVAMVEGEMDKELEMKVQIVSPVKEMVMPAQKGKVRFGPSGRAHLMFGIVNLPLKVTGEYKLQVFSGAKKIGETGFEVVKVETGQGGKVVN